MTHIEVSLLDSTTEFINHQVTAGHFATPSEYLGFLVEQARATAARESLDNLLEEGLHSGEPIQFSRERWQQRKAALLATLAD